MTGERATRRLGRRIAGTTGKLTSAALAVAMQQILRSTQVRIAYYDSTADPARPEYSEHCLFAFWHENLAILVPRWPRCPVTMLVSRHRDAQWLKFVADYLGFNVVRGSSTRGGSQAIRELRKLKNVSSLAMTPDGPQGPRRQMSLGALFLASRLQMPIVPVGVGYSAPVRLNTWDRFAIPRPFSRARIVFGPKIRLPSDLNRDALDHCRADAQRLLESLDEYATRWAVTGNRVLQEKPFVRVRRCQSLYLGQSPDAGIATGRSKATSSRAA